MDGVAVAEREAESLAEVETLAVASDRVETIRGLFDRIDKAEAASDPDRWEVAELVAAEVEAGKSCRQLAEELDRTAMFVSRYNRAWKAVLANPELRQGSFRSALAPGAVTRVTGKPRQLSAEKLLDVLEQWDAEGVALDTLAMLKSEAEVFAERIGDLIEDEEASDAE